MNANTVPGVETLIKDYMECKDKSLFFGKKRMDAEKEYNKLLTKYNGEVKSYSLEQANSIYKTYFDMLAFGEEAKKAETRFFEAEEKLKELGRILFDATISAQIFITPMNGDTPYTKTVTVTYDNGQVILS